MGFRITRSADTIVEIPLACDEALAAVNSPQRIADWAANHNLAGLEVPDDAVIVRIKPMSYAERCEIQDSAPIVNARGGRVLSEYLKAEDDSKDDFTDELCEEDRKALNAFISQTRQIRLAQARKMVVHVRHKLFDAPVSIDEFLSMVGSDADSVLLEIVSHCDELSSISEQQGKA